MLENKIVKVFNAPGYETEWEGELIAETRTVDNRPVAVIQDLIEGGWHVIPSTCVRDPLDALNGPDPQRLAVDPAYRARYYAECGCIAPCPDHSPKSEGRRDRDYWNSDPHGEEQSIVDHAERSVYDDDPDEYDAEDYDDGE